MEKVNARFLSREQIPQLVDLCVIDVSFISLTLILPRAFELITQDGMILALIKPQFELEREDVGGAELCASLHSTKKRSKKIVKFVEEANYHVGWSRSIDHHRNRWQPGIFYMHPKTIGLIAHPGKPGVGELNQIADGEFCRFSMSTLLEKETAAASGQRF